MNQTGQTVQDKLRINPVKRTDKFKRNGLLFFVSALVDLLELLLRFVKGIFRFWFSHFSSQCQDEADHGPSCTNQRMNSVVRDRELINQGSVSEELRGKGGRGDDGGKSRGIRNIEVIVILIVIVMVEWARGRIEGV